MSFAKWSCLVTASISVAVVPVLAQSTAPARNPTVAATTPDSSAEKTLTMQVFTVTGSNIKRVDQEKTLPVTIISGDDIAARDSATPMNLLEGVPYTRLLVDSHARILTSLVSVVALLAGILGAGGRS